MTKNETPQLNLYQKLQKIQEEILGLGKDKKSFNYSYVTGSKVLEHVKPLMNKYGLLLKQEITSIENSRQDYETKSGTKSEILSMVMMKFTWVDSVTGEKDENMFGANGMNDWEKGLGSALTYAERYFLLKYFHINTDEDDIDNPDRREEQNKPKPTISATRFKSALKSIEEGKYTKEALRDSFSLDEKQEKELDALEV